MKERCNAQGGDKKVPAGSYTQTCRQIYVTGPNLRAECQNRDLRWGWSQLDNFSQCTGNIFNDEGKLSCVRAGKP